MFFFVQFQMNKHLLIFSKTAKKKITRACLFQIALEIMWLPILNYADFALDKGFRLF